jgi:CII-binding regulator of phage lambda lysogenization HflD
VTVITNLKTLYEIDTNQWLEETIELLKANRFNELDLENLIEELEALGRNDKNAVESLLEQVIRHLLLLQYWLKESEYNKSHWQAEITGFRTQLKRRLTSNLRNHLLKELSSLYQDALAYVRQKTSLEVDFPAECPYSLEELLNINWFPRTPIH